jgi:cytochrome c553
MGVLALALSLPAAADANADRRAHLDYILHCSGCHEMNGAGHPAIGIPDFREQVGHYLRLPEGRAYLLQVPGLINAGLADERAAAVTNYVLTQFSGASLPADFQPLSADEARRSRETRPADILTQRHKLYVDLNAMGYALK